MTITNESKNEGLHFWTPNLLHNCFFRRSETMLGCCLDNCGEKICAPLVKQPCTSDSKACMSARGRAQVQVGGGKDDDGEAKHTAQTCVRFFLHCFQGQPGVMGVEGQPGLAGYTVSYRYWSFLPVYAGGMNVQKQMMCSLCTVQTEACAWAADLHLLPRPPRRCQALKLQPRLQIATLAKSECASISLTAFKESSGFLP